MTPRAIILDLDDTLYAERRFALSGYSAVAALVETEFGIDRESAFRSLSQSLRRGRRQNAFQDLQEHFALPETVLASWLRCYRAHQPRLRLLPYVRRALETLRRSWRVGLLTNGLPSVQAAKVSALGLERLVDAVTYADCFRGGKPAPEAFLESLRRLGAEAGRTVFAGDDVARDIEGARQVGMKTVLVDRRGTVGSGRHVADAVVRGLPEVPGVAERLVVAEESEHVG